MKRATFWDLWVFVVLVLVITLAMTDDEPPRRVVERPAVLVPGELPA